MHYPQESTVVSHIECADIKPTRRIVVHAGTGHYQNLDGLKVISVRKLTEEISDVKDWIPLPQSNTSG